MASDYFLTPTSTWRYALDVDVSDPSASLRFRYTGYVDGTAPFNHSGCPSSIVATLRPLPADAWPIEANSAAPPPLSPACAAAACGPAETRMLVPHGGTELRIGELPVAYAPAASRQRGARAAA